MRRSLCCAFCLAACAVLATAQVLIEPVAAPPDPDHLPPVVHAPAPQQLVNRTGASSPLYTLGPDDYLVVRALDVKEFPEDPVRVDGAGYISLPLIGRLEVQGRTIEQVEGEIIVGLRRYLKDPQVTVSISQFRPRPVSVFGAVGQPGVIQLRGPKTLWEVISDAGGFRNDVGNKVRITRRLDQGDLSLPGAKVDETGRYSVVEIDTRDILEMRDPDTNIDLMAHDVISVSEADIIYVVGHVNRAGGFVTNGSISLLEALSLAGGFQPNAKAKQAAILRVQQGTDERQVIPINLKDTLDGKAEDVALKPQDIVYVPHNAWKEFTLGLMRAAVGSATTASIYGATIYRNR